MSLNGSQADGRMSFPRAAGLDISSSTGCCPCSSNRCIPVSAAHRTPVQNAARWFCELDEMVDRVRE